DCPWSARPPSPVDGSALPTTDRTSGLGGAAVVDEVESKPTVWTKSFLTVVTAQMAFGYSGSTFLLLPKYLATKLGASASQIGHFPAISFFASVIAIPFVGGFIDRVGRKPLISIGCVLTAIYAGSWLFVDRLGLFVDAIQVIGGLAFM